MWEIVVVSNVVGFSNGCALIVPIDNLISLIKMGVNNSIVPIDMLILLSSMSVNVLIVPINMLISLIKMGINISMLDIDRWLVV